MSENTNPSSTADSNPLLSFASVIKNKSTGILKVQFGSNIVRQFAFSQGNCIDISTNLKEELPGSFLFQQKILNAEQYQTYLQECAKPKANHWLIANAQINLPAAKLAQKRKEHFRKVVSEIDWSKATAVNFHVLQNLKSDQAMTDTFDFASLLLSKLSIDHIQNQKKELLDPQTLVSVVAETDKGRLSEDQEGLFTVIQHNATLGEILDSSFLEKHKIYQWILAFEMARYIRIESDLEFQKRRFFESLSLEQKKAREFLKSELQKITRGSFYECLELETDVDAQDIEKAFESRITKFSSPLYQGIFFEGEENCTPIILEKINHAYAVLSNPEKKNEYDMFVHKGNTGSFVDQSQTLLEETLLQQYDTLLKSRKFDDALKFLMDEIAKAPNLVKLYAALVDLVKSMNMVSNETLNQKIFTMFKDGISKNPRESKLFILLGEWCLFLQQKANALKAFQKALNLDASSKKIRNYILQLDKYTGKQIIIEAILANLDTLNHFEIMGIEPTATQQDVREAYRDASRNFHPDLFFASQSSKLKDMAKRVFKEIVASYLLLRHEDQRKEYVESLFSSQKKRDEKQKIMIPKSVQARKYYDQANFFLQSKNYSSAKLNIQLALSYEPDNYLLQKMLKEVQSKLTNQPA